ncbi:hypothetical protein EVAR_77244_1 [Eumeta japonica]|uniref:Uncharacterized protein n=1 Tax=Eumeta variegata TaxID=151549 RepID=A0A4C1ULA2_EUMVA|nr:hypothetical protein EVAR_77244_1 [Eumeta japonica]
MQDRHVTYREIKASVGINLKTKICCPISRKKKVANALYSPVRRTCPARHLASTYLGELRIPIAAKGLRSCSRPTDRGRRPPSSKYYGMSMDLTV